MLESWYLLADVWWFTVQYVLDSSTCKLIFNEWPGTRVILESWWLLANARWFRVQYAPVSTTCKFIFNE